MALIVVPARLKSTRLPQKLIQKISGKEIILHLCDQLKPLQQSHELVVTTDSLFIQGLIEDYCDFYVRYCTKGYNNGTERIANVALDYTDHNIVVNIQADEYDISADDIEHLISSLEQSGKVNISTLVGPLADAQLTNTSVVKAILDDQHEALDFLRELNSSAKSCYGHHGVYGYRNRTLQEISKLPATSKEKARSLEQMRWLESGYRVHCVLTDRVVKSLNTIEDLRHIRKSYHSK